MDLRIILILAAAVSPSPAPTPVADPCIIDGHTALLGALDRPTVGYSPCAVRQGEGVAEAGYQNQAGNPPLATYPQAFLRYGLGPALEADIIPPSRNGATDTGFGVKWEAAHDARDALGFDFLYTAPAATVNVDYSRSLSALFGFGTTVGIERTNAYTSVVPSAVLTDQFNPRAQLYAEAFGQTKTRPGGGALFGLDGGLQYLVTPAIELDLELGQTATDRSRGHYIGAGFGVRF